MPQLTDYREINQANWDDRVPTHLASELLPRAAFSSRSRTSSATWWPVRPAAARRVSPGLRGAHLQCHLGTDTISLAPGWARR